MYQLFIQNENVNNALRSVLVVIMISFKYTTCVHLKFQIFVYLILVYSPKQ